MIKWENYEYIGDDVIIRDINKCIYTLRKGTILLRLPQTTWDKIFKRLLYCDTLNDVTIDCKGDIENYLLKKCEAAKR